MYGITYVNIIAWKDVLKFFEQLYDDKKYSI